MSVIIFLEVNLMVLAQPKRHLCRCCLSCLFDLQSTVAVLCINTDSVNIFLYRNLNMQFLKGLIRMLTL